MRPISRFFFQLRIHSFMPRWCFRCVLLRGKEENLRQLKEVLRLPYDLGLLQSEIARSCCISQSRVNRYLERASAAGLSWPLSEDRADRLLNLNELLFPAEPMGGRPQGTGTPGLRRHSLAAQSSKYVTLQLLWKEYRQSQPEGYRHGCFCELYQCWRRKRDLVLRQDHLAGEKNLCRLHFYLQLALPD
jgi:hypothetical protein